MRIDHITRDLLLAVLIGMLALFPGVGCSEDDSLKVTKLSRREGIPGDKMTIYGSGFQSGGRKNVRVFFGTRKARVLGFKGNGQLTVEVPGGIATGKTVDLKLVFEPGGEITYEDAFKYVELERTTVDDLLGGGKKDEKGKKK